MRMKLRYIYYHLKALLKRREPWVLIFAVVLLIFVFKGITLPSADNTKVGIVTNGSERAKRVAELMDEDSTIYSVCEYETEEELLTDVRKGALECGFIFDDDFDKLVSHERMKESIQYIYSPYTTKGLVAKESLYSAFLKDYSDDILLSEYRSIFGSNDDSLKEEIEDMLIERNAYYLDGNDIFEVDFK